MHTLFSTSCDDSSLFTVSFTFHVVVQSIRKTFYDSCTFEQMFTRSDVFMMLARFRRRRPVEQSEEIDRMVQVFRALADRSRLRILILLDSGERYCVSDIARKLNLNPSNVSHHLIRLMDMGFVEYSREGKQVYYYLTDQCVRDIMRRAREHVTD